MTLSQTVDFTENIWPICRPSQMGIDDYAGVPAPVAGWGHDTWPGGNMKIIFMLVIM